MKNHLIYSLSLISLIAISCTNFTNKKEDPTQWRGPNRDGIYYEQGLLKEWPEKGPSLLWEYSELGRGYSSPVIVKDKIFINGTIDSMSYLFLFDINGNLLWKKDYGFEWMETYPGVRSSPYIVEDYIYILSGLGELVCLYAENGETIWKMNLHSKYGAKTIQHGLSENLLIDGDVLYCTPGGDKHNIIALNRFTGDLIWSNTGNSEKSAYCNPILIEIRNEKFLITITDKSTIAIKAQTGELAWTYPMDGVKWGIHANTPYYRDGYLFIMDGYEVGSVMLKIAEDGKSAERVWKNEFMDETQGHSVVIGDNIYGSAETQRKLVCLDWKTGKIKFELEKYAPSTVISAENLLYVYTYDGKLSIVEPKENEFVVKGEITFDKKEGIHIAHPVIHKGRLYVRYMNKLMVYDIKA